MQILCPHCQCSLELTESAMPDEVCCSSCGSSFRPDKEKTTDWKPEKQMLGKFELLQTLGQGAFGTVYEAHDPELDRVVAIKVPRSGRLASAEDLDRFVREARSVGQLRHPSIVSVYEAGQAENLPYLICEFIKGVTLADLMSSRRLRPREAAEFIAAVADALHYAHEHGVIHRDVKPANIMVDEKQLPRLMDFGLAKRETGDVTMTTEGQVLGTPAYMSPEQASGRSHRVDGRSDVYSLGVVLYQMLTGELPFRGTPRMLLHQVLNDEPRRARSLNENIPKDLDTICLKAMAKEPARRYQTAGELAEDLRRFLRGEPISARPVSAWEKTLSWARRRPAMVGLLAASAIAMFALVAAAVGSFYNTRLAAEKRAAEHARDSAERSRLGEEEQRKKAESFLYFSRISLAEREWSANNVRRAGQLLQECPANLRGWEWNYLMRMCHSELRTLRGHGQAVNSVAFSPDGQRLVTAGYDKTMKIWNVATGKQEASFGLREVSYCLTFSPGGERLALAYRGPEANEPSDIDLLDTSTWERRVTLRGHASPVYGVAFDASGHTVASAGYDATLRIWDAASGRSLHTLRTAAIPCSKVAFSHDGHVLAGAVGDPDEIPRTKGGHVSLWDVASGKLLRTLEGHEGAVLCVAFSPDGKHLASAGKDQTIRIWDYATGKEIRTLRGHTGRITTVTFTPKDRLLVSASYDGSVRLWDSSDGRLLRTLRGHTGAVNWVALNPGGDRLASVGVDGTMKIWDPALDPDCRSLPLRATAALSVSYSPDGKQLAASGTDGAMKIFDAVNGREILTSVGHSRAVWRFAFSPSGDRLVSASEDETARIWDATNGREIRSLKGHTKWVQCATFSPDGQRIATASGDQTVKLWNAQMGRELRTLVGHTDRIASVAFSPDGSRLASCASDKLVILWNSETGEQVAQLQGHTDEVFIVAFNSDGRLLASGAEDLTVRIWDAVTGKNTLTLEGHTGYVVGLAFSPDGQRLASASIDQTVKVWDLATGQELLTLRADTGGFHSVAFSPDGKQLAASGYDGTVRIWDATPFSDLDVK